MYIPLPISMLIMGPMMSTIPIMLGAIFRKGGSGDHESRRVTSSFSLRCHRLGTREKLRGGNSAPGEKERKGSMGSMGIDIVFGRKFIFTYMYIDPIKINFT